MIILSWSIQFQNPSGTAGKGEKFDICNFIQEKRGKNPLGNCFAKVKINYIRVKCWLNPLLIYEAMKAKGNDKFLPWKNYHAPMTYFCQVQVEPGGWLKIPSDNFRFGFCTQLPNCRALILRILSWMMYVLELQSLITFSFLPFHFKVYLLQGRKCRMKRFSGFY